MAFTYDKNFQPQQLAAASALIFTLPASPISNRLRNQRVRLVNSTAGAVAATLYAVPAAGAAGVTNVCLDAYSIAAHSYLDIDTPKLSAGDSLWGFASSAASITIHELDGVVTS